MKRTLQEYCKKLPSFPYEILWGERTIFSVANLTCRDREEFLKLAPEVPVDTEVGAFPLEKTNEVLGTLHRGEVQGPVVLVTD